MSNQPATSINPVMIEGQQVTIRPIEHSDTFLESDFIAGLSAQTKHYRFLGGVGQLSAEEIKRLCDVDYHDSMAFVATILENEQLREIGVARYVKDTITQSHEMAVTIADDFLHSRLGRLLVEYLAAYGRKHGVKCLFSIDLNDNAIMRKLAEDLNMSVRLDPDDSHQVIYSLNVDEHPETIKF